MAIDTVSVTANAPTTGSKPPIAAFNNSDGPHFSDVLDILNPLQHIPIISTIYQHLTGDSEGAVAEAAGGALWGGPIGLVTSLIDLAVKSDTGKSIGDNVLTWLGMEDDDSGVAVANSESGNPANPASPAAQTVQQQAAAIALPPTVVAQALPAPKARNASAKDDSQSDGDKESGVQRMGDYMVFGAAGSGQPIALTPIAQASAAAPANGQVGRQGGYMVFGGNGGGGPVTPAPAAATAAASAATASATTQQGSFMVFGASQPPAPAPSPATTVVSAAASAAAAPAPPPAGLSPMPARSFVVPARRTQVTPNTLPPPTTGPAALPGHGPSQAIPAANDSWFANAVNAGLDKYQAAQKLTESDTLSTGSDMGATLH